MRQQEQTTEQLIERGRTAFARGAYPLALASLREVVKREPGYADIHNLIGLCLSLTGQAEGAVEAFDEAIRINPRYVEALVNRAITLNELGRYEEAQLSFQAASEADTEEGVARFPSVLASHLANKHLELGELYSAGGALAEAAEQFRRALELRPRFADVRNSLARALLEQGEVDAAIQELEQTLQINPAFLEARINLGLAWYRKGDHAAAEREWTLCRQQQPGNPQVESYLGMLERSR